MKTITINQEDFTTESGINRFCADAYKKGLRFNSFVYGGIGNKWHRSLEAAERSAKRRARAACPDNPPCWWVAEMKLAE